MLSITFVLLLMQVVVLASAIDSCLKKCTCHPSILDCKGLTQDDITSDDFQNIITPDLEKIHITDGTIERLPKNLLGSCKGDSSQRLVKLEKLDLQNNGFTDIDGQAFHCIPNLKELILAYNQWNVSGLHTGIFTNIPNLEKLNLTSAFNDKIAAPVQLAHLNTVFLENDLSKLEVLSLDYNRFSVFDRNSAVAICSFPALRRLNLANNLLPKITFHHINCFPHLEKLDLSYNSIITFEDEKDHNGLLYGLDFIQSGSPNLTVNFIGNEFDCDCGLLGFHDWLKRTRVHVMKKTELTCHDGLLYNSTITSLQTVDFKCLSVNTSTSANGAAIGVVVTMFVLISLVLVLVAYLKRDSIKRFVTSWRKPSLAREHLFGYSSVNNENATDIEV